MWSGTCLRGIPDETWACWLWHSVQLSCGTGFKSHPSIDRAPGFVFVLTCLESPCPSSIVKYTTSWFCPLFHGSRRLLNICINIYTYNKETLADAWRIFRQGLYRMLLVTAPLTWLFSIEWGIPAEACEVIVLLSCRPCCKVVVHESYVIFRQCISLFNRLLYSYTVTMKNLNLLV